MPPLRGRMAAEALRPLDGDNSTDGQNIPLAAAIERIRLVRQSYEPRRM